VSETELGLPGEIQGLSQAFLCGLNRVLGEKLVALYLYGAVAFPEGGATGDVDFHVILREALNDGEKTGLDELHAALARDYPPLGAELDGYYLLLEQAHLTTLPQHQLRPEIRDNSWALHREHIRAGRCIVLHGPDPKQIYPAASWPELAAALDGEWDFVAVHLEEVPAYCVLNLCRLVYSYSTRDVVVSKRASAAWATGIFPAWRPLIAAAINFYDRRATAEDVALLQAEVGSFFAFAEEQIAEGRSAGSLQKGLISRP